MSTATEMLAKYLEAETAVLAGKDVSFGDRRLSMADLQQIVDGRKDWERRVAEETARLNKTPRIGGLTLSVASFNNVSSGRFSR